MAQTTFTANPPKGLPGMPVDMGPKDDRSMLAEEELAPGVFVVWGTTERQALLPSAAFTDADVVGVTVRTHKARRDGAVADNENYEAEARVPVRRKGRIWVTVENAFTPGAAIYARHTASGGNTTIGAVRVTDNDTNTASAIAGARLLNSGDAGDLGLLELNLP